MGTIAGRPRAHPRSRGEHRWLNEVAANSAGSSPLARGTRGGCAGWCGRWGLIPARAGNTEVDGLETLEARAHPRSRGEHNRFRVLAEERLGSSPLARGTQPLPCPGRGTPGLIPARAGNTQPSPATSQPAGAHPRSRGEHARLGCHFCSSEGSSPLARGTRCLECGVLLVSGLIPARAGNTTASIIVPKISRAHPRSRGEHVPVVSHSPVWAGSSPLARGTRHIAHKRRQILGLIPARAGNTQEWDPVPELHRAHPRSRGEHWSSRLSPRSSPGSSPLARGTRGTAGCE